MVMCLHRYSSSKLSNQQEHHLSVQKQLQVGCASGDHSLWGILWTVLINVSTWEICSANHLLSRATTARSLSTRVKLSLFTGTLQRATVWCIRARAVKKWPPVRRRWRCSAMMAARQSTPTFQLTSVVAEPLNVLRPSRAEEKLKALLKWHLTNLSDFF